MNRILGAPPLITPAGWRTVRRWGIRPRQRLRRLDDFIRDAMEKSLFLRLMAFFAQLPPGFLAFVQAFVKRNDPLLELFRHMFEVLVFERHGNTDGSTASIFTFGINEFWHFSFLAIITVEEINTQHEQRDSSILE